jgi:hypothetical protein
MGSQNEKRLKDLAQENPAPQTSPNPNPLSLSQTQSNPPAMQRMNPYDQRSNMQPNMNNNNNNNPNPQNNFNNNQNNKGIAKLQRSMTQRQRNVITTKILRDAFRNYCIDNDYLNRPRFNDAIESIFRFNIPLMHYTYLSDKIYDLLDSSGDGKIQEDEFLDGFTTVLKDKNYRMLLSMMAMMSLPDKSRDYIEISEIKDFFFNSYVEAYRHLGHLIQKEASEYRRNNLPVATVKQLGKWAKKFEKEVKDYIDKDLKAFFPNITTSINFEQFKRWISQDHNIYVSYGNKNITIATSLLRLDDIRYEEDTSNKLMNYPSM